MGRLQFRILGPLEVWDGEKRLPLGGKKRRALLAVLLLHANEVVSSDRLIDELWGEYPPETATTALRGLVGQLRRLLERESEDELLRTRPPGYELALAGEQLDLKRFERLAQEGREALARGDPLRASLTLREALSLWHGPALADLRYTPSALAHAPLLEERRLACLEERVEADLALGRHGELVAELEGAVAEDPLRERLRGQLMLALYRADRQAEALELYRDTRRLLSEELGIEPSPPLQELHQAILRHDPALEAAPVRTESADSPGADQRSRSRAPSRRALLVAALAGVVAAAVAIPVFALSGDEAPSSPVGPNSVGIIDPATNEIVGEVPVGARPGDVAHGSGSIWVANLDDKTISRIDPDENRVAHTISLEAPPLGLAAGLGAVWTFNTEPNASSTVRRVDPRYELPVKSIRVRGGIEGQLALGGIATGEGSVWVGPPLGLLTRIDPVSTRTLATIDSGNNPTDVAVGAGAVWVADSGSNNVARIDPETELVTSVVPVGHGPSGIAVGFGAVWVADTLDNAVVRIDPATNAITTTIPVGAAPVGVAVGAGSVWVANSGDGTVSRIDPSTHNLEKTFEIGGRPFGITVAAGRVWVSVDADALPGGEVRNIGGTVRLTSESDVDFLDPALAFTDLSWQLQYATCAKLFNFPHEAAPIGSQPVPEVAVALPTRSPDGKTHTFTIRKGFRFSPPSNAPITAQTFKYSIERAFHPKLDSPVNYLLGDLVGVRAYRDGKAAHISGVQAHGDTLTIKLVAPAQDLPVRLTMPLFCAVPLDTPVDPHGVRTVPSAGPYYVASYTPGRGVVLERNPNYSGSRPRRPKRIELTVGVGKANGLSRVEAGTADYAIDGVPDATAARLAARYGAGSAAAKAGRRRYFVNPRVELAFIAMNTSRPLFADVRLRRAVNYAIDRTALARDGAGSVRTAPAVPTDQYLPPGLPGFRDVRIYPLTPHVAQARRLAGSGTRTAVLYTCNLSHCRRKAQILERDLQVIGITLQTKTFPVRVLIEKLGTRAEPFDLALGLDWVADYPDPSQYLNLLLAGDPIRAVENLNWAYFDDPVYNRKLAKVAKLSGAGRFLAYGALDIDLARNAAPWAAYANTTRQDFFSARIGCQIYNPVYGIDLAALCVRKSRAKGS